MGQTNATDYRAFLDILNNPKQFPPDCLEVDYMWEGGLLYLTLRHREHPDNGWHTMQMIPLRIGRA